MQTITIAAFSVLAYFVIQKLAKVTKLESQILYLITGILIGIILKMTPYHSLEILFPVISQYNAIALLFIFFISGFSINLKQLKKSGKITAKLFSIPAYTEMIIMSFLISWLTPLTYIESLIVAAIFAVASPANMISICSNMMQEGYTGKNNMPATMIMAAIVDSFITIPVVFASIFILMSQQASVLKISGIIAFILIGIILALITGIVLGKLELAVTKKIFNKLNNKNEEQYLKYILILSSFLIALLFSFLLQSINQIQKAVTLFGILIMFGIGLSINHYDISGANQIIARNGNKLFAMFGMPVIFIYVGSIIELKVLFNIKLLLVFSVITAVSVCVKGLVTKLILKKETYTEGERNFAASCFIPKGVALINFSVIFGAILGTESQLVKFMTMLAAIGIIITMTFGIPIIRKAKGKWIQKAREV